MQATLKPAKDVTSARKQAFEKVIINVLRKEPSQIV